MKWVSVSVQQVVQQVAQQVAHPASLVTSGARYLREPSPRRGINPIAENGVCGAAETSVSSRPKRVSMSGVAHSRGAVTTSHVVSSLVCRQHVHEAIHLIDAELGAGGAFMAGRADKTRRRSTLRRRRQS